MKLARLIILFEKAVCFERSVKKVGKFLAQFHLKVETCHKFWEFYSEFNQNSKLKMFCCDCGTPAVHVQEEGEKEDSRFDDPAVRRSFIRKVYSILSVSLKII